MTAANVEPTDWLKIRQTNPAAFALRRFMQRHAITLGEYGTRAVYFVQVKESRGCGPIKIGMSSAPLGRLSDLQVGCPYPIVLLGTIRGGFSVERALHLMFGARRLNGEWFKPNRRMLRFISQLLSRGEEQPRHNNAAEV